MQRLWIALSACLLVSCSTAEEDGGTSSSGGASSSETCVRAVVILRGDAPSPLSPRLQGLLPHSGGTDSEGCHTDSATGERHCHGDDDEDEDGTPSDTCLAGEVRVVDGDTFELSATTIRLAGVDAFEHDQLCQRDGEAYACGERSTAYLEDLLEDQTVFCEQTGTSYSRVVATCSFGEQDDEQDGDEQDVGAAMVRSGWALDEPRYDPSYVTDEEYAEENGLGAHAGEFCAPWDFRSGACE